MIFSTFVHANDPTMLLATKTICTFLWSSQTVEIIYFWIGEIIYKHVPWVYSLMRKYFINISQGVRSGRDVVMATVPNMCWPNTKFLLVVVFVWHIEKLDCLDPVVVSIWLTCLTPQLQWWDPLNPLMKFQGAPTRDPQLLCSALGGRRCKGW